MLVFTTVKENRLDKRMSLEKLYSAISEQVYSLTFCVTYISIGKLLFLYIDTHLNKKEISTSLDPRRISNKNVYLTCSYTEAEGT